MKLQAACSATKDEAKDRRSFTEPARTTSVWKNPPGSIRDPWPQAVQRRAWCMACAMHAGSAE